MDVIDDITLDTSVLDECAMLDNPITEDEITCAVNNLGNDKACGIDGVYNEYIKSSLSVMMPIYVKLFNCVLDNGIVPEAWVTGYITPIYKGKGDPSNPDNYRGITIVSCLGKLFTSIISKRLQNYSDSIDLISKAQAGFRKSFSTIAHVYVLKSLIDIYKHFD